MFFRWTECNIPNFWGNALTKPPRTQSFFSVAFVPSCVTPIFWDNTTELTKKRAISGILTYEW